MTTKQFYKKATSILSFEEGVVETTLGLLNIRVMENWIHMRFEDVDMERFEEMFPYDNVINPWSFKWNIFSHDNEQVIGALEYRLHKLGLQTPANNNKKANTKTPQLV